MGPALELTRRADRLRADPSGKATGEVFTRPWVVELILDLVGYTADHDLGALAVLEPACGSGAFLGPMVDRLVESCRRHQRSLASCLTSVQAFDLQSSNVELARKEVARRLIDAGVTTDAAEAMAANWVRVDDFLLTAEASVADLVVGNPPYVRLEHLPAELSAAYRAACPTMRGRADLYVGFIERGLGLLRPGGRLGFICADRWMHNEYGAALRSLVADQFSVECVVRMHDVDAFEVPVSAYPAITVIRSSPQGRAAVVETTSAFNAAAAKDVSTWHQAERRRPRHTRTHTATVMDAWFAGDRLWPSAAPDDLALLRQLEARFPSLEHPSTGTRVGIGVATGCDEVYITDDPDLVEPDRLLPLATAADLSDGVAHWGGRFLVNPWRQGELIDLRAFPRTSRFLSRHRARLAQRHVAERRPAQWYRTIDRVDPLLLARPKLLLPDIKADARPALDTGNLYPHHNLYHVTSDVWDLEVLGGLLLSDIANLFVGAYCVKMRGGTYRFQAQYLRQIRVPDPTSLPPELNAQLAQAFRAHDPAAATAAAIAAYDLPVRAATSLLRSRVRR